MKTKNVINWIIVTIISTALVITTIATSSSNKKNNEVTNISQYIITETELKTLIQKIKNKNTNTKKIKNIDLVLKEKIIDHIKLNINNKKTKLICTKTEILYTIINANFFKTKNTFSPDLYKNYLQNTNLKEAFFQKKLKNKLENTRIPPYIEIKKNYQTRQLKQELDYLTYHINKITYVIIPKSRLIKKINIKNTEYFNFEKNIIHSYRTPIIYKIKYLVIKNNKNIKNKKFITSAISKIDINERLSKIIYKNSKNSIIIKTPNRTYLIKIKKKIENKLTTYICKEDIINRYKQKLIKKFSKNKTAVKKYKKIKSNQKLISERSKKSNLSLKIKSVILSKEDTLILNNENILVILSQLQKPVVIQKDPETIKKLYNKNKIIKKYETN